MPFEVHPQRAEILWHKSKNVITLLRRFFHSIYFKTTFNPNVFVLQKKSYFSVTKRPNARAQLTHVVCFFLRVLFRFLRKATKIFLLKAPLLM